MLKNKTLSKFTAKTKEIHQQTVGPISGSALFTKTSPQAGHELHLQPVREEPFTGTPKAERQQRRFHFGGADGCHCDRGHFISGSTAKLP